MRQEFAVSTAGLGAAFDFVARRVCRGAPGPAAPRRNSVMLDEVCANLLRHDGSFPKAERFSLEFEPRAGETVSVIPEASRPFDPLEAHAAPETGGHELALIRVLSTSARYPCVVGLNRLILSVTAGE